MTKEELEKEAEEKAIKAYGVGNDWSVCAYKNGYLAGAEPREKQIQIEIDAKHIIALQKQNGELTDKCRTLEDKLANADYQLEGRDLEIKELEAQIEKMKQDLDSARENANRQEQWEIYSVLNGIYNDNFEVITSVSN